MRCGGPRPADSHSGGSGCSRTAARERPMAFKWTKASRAKLSRSQKARWARTATGPQSSAPTRQCRSARRAEATTTRKLSEARHARESFTQNGSTGDPYRRVVHRPWRKVKVTERRAAEDYAQCMRDLVDLHYPDVIAHPAPKLPNRLEFDVSRLLQVNAPM